MVMVFLVYGYREGDNPSKKKAFSSVTLSKKKRKTSVADEICPQLQSAPVAYIVSSANLDLYVVDTKFGVFEFIPESNSTILLLFFIYLYRKK
jgi:hypothetical protein